MPQLSDIKKKIQTRMRARGFVRLGKEFGKDFQFQKEINDETYGYIAFSFKRMGSEDDVLPAN